MSLSDFTHDTSTPMDNSLLIVCLLPGYNVYSVRTNYSHCCILYAQVALDWVHKIQLLRRINNRALTPRRYDKFSFCSTSRFRWRFISSSAKRNQSCRLQVDFWYVRTFVHSLFCPRRCWHLSCAASCSDGAPLWDEIRLRLPCGPTYFAQSMTKTRRSASGWDRLSYSSYDAFSSVWFVSTINSAMYQVGIHIYLRRVISDSYSLNRVWPHSC